MDDPALDFSLKSSSKGLRQPVLADGSSHIAPSALVQLAKRTIFTTSFINADSPVGVLGGPQACGKSTVAIALARDADVRAVFADGIIWLRCGANASPKMVLRHLLEVVRAVQDATSTNTVPFLVNIAQCAPHSAFVTSLTPPAASQPAAALLAARRRLCPTSWFSGWRASACC